jgi:hypothetical protein
MAAAGASGDGVTSMRGRESGEKTGSCQFFSIHLTDHVVGFSSMPGNIRGTLESLQNAAFPFASLRTVPYGLERITEGLLPQ